ncbi:MAG: phosphoribosylamine--glycine ligase [Lentimicrobium sp.]|nr:phosphoribosylamine--glycine ligase [Lentimicrobium sp.]
MNILLLGSGGREHAIAWKLSQSTEIQKLYIAPGNAGTGLTGINVPIDVNDFEAIKLFVLENDIDMVVVGPEEPLVNGIYDFFKGDGLLTGIPVIGPSAAGARLEGSKGFAKSFMQRHGIPTAAYRTFSTGETTAAIEFLSSLKPPYVLKADGLAAGKGVIICNELAEATREVTDMLDHARFGKASEKVVIEEFLSGIELSVFVLTDGKSWILLPEAKDYKRIGEGDTGPNTGGMGSVSPVPFADEIFMEKVKQRIIEPTIEGLQSESIDYKGFIFFGLISVKNEPYVIEYNVRMGDPETESVMPRIKSDLLSLFRKVADQSLASATVEFNENCAATVMLVSAGYPGNYSKGHLIQLPDTDLPSMLFHAGTRFDEENKQVVTAGGRVIAVTSTATDMAQALALSYKTAGQIHFEGKNFRTDIGFDLHLTK